MNPNNNSSAIQAKKATPNPSEPMKPHEASVHHHLKFDNRDKRIRLSPPCANIISKLQQKLGHKNPGRTVEWLLEEAKPSVDVALNGSDGSSCWDGFAQWIKTCCSRFCKPWNNRRHTDGNGYGAVSE